MKNLILASVAVLTLGFTSLNASSSFSAPTKPKVTQSQTNCLPIPVCPPDDANACGM